MRLWTTIPVIAACLLASGLACAGQIGFSAGPSIEDADGRSCIAFTLFAKTDVEVAILDSGNRVVRHLAAGLLGGEYPPPPPLTKGLSQRVEWDGKDDYGEPAKGGPFKVRVQAGMGVKLDRIVGGDPYAFYSRDSGQGDHFPWKIAGLEAKSDGSVYVMGNSIYYGGQVIRQYDAVGQYRKTVFPPPAGTPPENVKGWGINVRADGTFTMRNGNNWQSSSMGTTPIAENYGKIKAGLVPSSDADVLTMIFDVKRQFVRVGTDGTLKSYDPRPFFGSVPVPGLDGRPPKFLRGPCYTALAPDGKHLYMSGLHSCRQNASWSRAESVDTSGFWRDGQVWKMDLATREMSVFYALDEKTVVGDMTARSKGPIADANYVNPCSAFHGVAVDAAGHVFVGDRQNKRVVVLDADGKIVRELPVEYPDAVAVNPKSRAVYVTTRFGDYSGRGELKLVKFNDWSKDNIPSATVPLVKGVGKYGDESLLATVENGGQVIVWVAYTTLPVRLYRDAEKGLELVKDFYEAASQRALDLQHMQVDQKTGHAYIADGGGWCFRVADWNDPKFELLMEPDGKKRLEASSLAIDSRRRYLYAKYHYTGGARRYRLDGKALTPAPVGTSGNEVTGKILCGWGFSGIRERGIAAAPDGGLATLGLVKTDKYNANDYSGYLNYWKPDASKAPWEQVPFEIPGKSPNRGGIRFDARGNLYVGIRNGKPKDVPPGYEKDPTYEQVTGTICKYAPTGSIESGCLFPTAPAAPVKNYDIHYSPLPTGYRTPRFGVDGYGRIYYPSGVESRVGVIDNEGNPILGFGTWGNRDSMGGLPGDLAPTKDIPMACPNSVDATDGYIYISDMNNVRLLRLAKTFVASAALDLP